MLSGIVIPVKIYCKLGIASVDMPSGIGGAVFEKNLTGQVLRLFTSPFAVSQQLKKAKMWEEVLLYISHIRMLMRC